MSGPFEGLTVLVTGQVAGHSRAAVQALVHDLGGTPVGSVSAKTGLVVLGEGAGLSKLEKIRTHRLRVIAAASLLDLAEGRVTTADLTIDGLLGEPIDVYEERVEAEAASADGGEPGPSAPRPGDPDWVPLSERHLVGRATCYLPAPEGSGKRTVRQIRMSCQCGHKWLGSTIGDALTCPIETGDQTEPVTVAPWAC